jgi:hypothetical protein
MENEEKNKKSKDSGQRHKAQVERYGEAKTRALEVAQYIERNITKYSQKDQIRLGKAWDKLHTCANFLEYHYSKQKDEYRLVKAYFCKNRFLDGICALRWSDKAVAKYYEKHLQVLAENPHLKTAMLTLTVKNGSRLGDTFKKLEEALTKVSQAIRDARRKGFDTEFGKIKGMVLGIEVKKTKKGLWHPHAHAFVIMEEYLNQKKLSEEWYQKTGDSFIVDIRSTHTAVYGLCEVLSYSIKFSTMEPKDQVETFLKLSGKMMVRATGVYRNVKPPEKLTDEPLEDLEYVQLIYRFVKSKSCYDLKNCKKVYKDKEEGLNKNQEFTGYF